jgi:hypothetical protein
MPAAKAKRGSFPGYCRPLYRTLRTFRYGDGHRVAIEGQSLNLSFPPLGKDAATTSLTADFAVMLVGVAARQAASPTAMLFQSRMRAGAYESALLAPVHGAFNQAMACRLQRWKEALPRRPD